MAFNYQGKPRQSTLGQVLPLAGTIVGGAFGGPAGAAIGSTVGGIAGSKLAPPTNPAAPIQTEAGSALDRRMAAQQPAPQPQPSPDEYHEQLKDSMRAVASAGPDVQEQYMPQLMELFRASYSDPNRGQGQNGFG
jgi:phage tail tape-measure protein